MALTSNSKEAADVDPEPRIGNSAALPIRGSGSTSAASFEFEVSAMKNKYREGKSRVP
jgi:hypothetical protein